ncbi:MAG: PucR family transcriptional regulator [Corynebacteriales bacterium]|nr:PucR family transcriptional regulator [Mycobacteriales bacterium]
MATTVGWLLDQRALDLRSCTGSLGLDRPIDCALTSELVDAADWLSGGELLLTTGMRLPDDRDGRRRYLASLAEAGVAAIGFGTGLGYDTVPDDLVDIGTDLGLPVLEVPLPVPFSAIARTLLDRVADDRYAQFTRAARSQPAMTRAVIAGGVPALAGELAAALDHTVVVIDRDGRVVCSRPRAADPVAMTHVRRALGPDHWRSRAASATGVTITDDHTITVQRISSGGAVVGHLAVIGDRPLGDLQRVLVGHASSLITLQHNGAGDVAAERAQLHADVLGFAIRGDTLPATAETMLLRAADDDGLVRVVVFEFRSSTVAAEALGQLASALEQRWRPVFCTRDGREVVVLLRGDDDTATAQSLGAGLRMRAGLGDPVALCDIAASTGQARQAARAAVDGEVVDLVTTRSVLAIDGVQDGLRGLHDIRLRPLLEVRAAGGADLVTTLRRYLEANGHWESAAAAIGVHRHTLRQRVSRIEGLLGVDLADARTRAELLLILLSGDRPPAPRGRAPTP